MHHARLSTALDAWRDTAEAMAEKTFMAFYGSPALQAALGIDPASAQPQRKAAKSALHQALKDKRIAELRSQIALGGLREATIRSLSVCRHGTQMPWTNAVSR